KRMKGMDRMELFAIPALWINPVEKTTARQRNESTVRVPTDIPDKVRAILAPKWAVEKMALPDFTSAW
ncbi:MAG: hypothetical protein NT069_20780, partial [Planctomycetota bacterium]|nr:hypothetical protein [Planctomycetota bacterium]